MTAGEQDATVVRQAWGRGTLVAFRFAFVYVILYCFPLPEDLSDLPWNPGAVAWHAVVPWIGAHLVHLSEPISLDDTGSGDTTYFFVRLLSITALALVTTAVWSIVDRRRREHAVLHAWLRVYLRHVLAFVMVGYGLAKVMGVQFFAPNGDQLTLTYAESSPMGLMWRFVGSSAAYRAFGGALELLGAALLLYPATTTLGALVVAGVMSNVAMMNLCYDVPVKIGSIHCVLLACLLVLPDLRRLARFFVLHLPTEGAPEVALFTKPRQRRAALAIKLVLTVGVVAQSVLFLTKLRRDLYPPPREGSPEGAFEVETFTRDGREVPPLVGDATRWQRVFFYGNKLGRAFMMDGRTRVVFFHADDLASHTTTLTKRADPPVPLGTLHYAEQDAATLTLSGTLEGAPVEIRLKKIDTSKMPLLSRGFHWISERPYNR